MTENSKAAAQDSSQVDRHDRQLDALHRISQVLSTVGAQRPMLAEVLDVLHTRLDLTRGTIMLLSPDGKELSVEMAHSLFDRRNLSARVGVGEGITGRVVQTGEPAIIPKVSQEPLFLDRIHRRRAISKEEISFLCVPIAIGREVVGALSADRIFDELLKLRLALSATR